MPEAEGPNGAIPALSEVAEVDQWTGLPFTETRRRLDEVSPFDRHGRLRTSMEARLQAVSKIDRQSGLPKQGGER